MLAAYDEAAGLFTRALDTYASSSVSQPVRRCELLLDLGAARIRSGDTTAGRAVYLEAAAVARQHGLADQLADAAIGYAGLTGYHFSGRRDDTLVATLEEALATLPPGDSEIRARLLARLSVGVYWSDLDGRRFELSEEAVAMARRLRDRSTMAMTVHSRRYAQWGPDNLDQRLADATQCLQLALEANDLELAVSARRWRFTDLLEDGDGPSAEREIDAHDALARRLRQPFLFALTAQFRALWAMMQGQFAPRRGARARGAAAQRAGRKPERGVGLRAADVPRVAAAAPVRRPRCTARDRCAGRRRTRRPRPRWRSSTPSSARPSRRRPCSPSSRRPGSRSSVTT